MIPKTTILIENPIAVAKTSAEHGGREQLPALPPDSRRAAGLRRLRLPAGREERREANRKKFPVRPGLFTIDQLGLGGWNKVQKRFFDPKTGIMARFERQVGGVTG